MVIMNQNIIFFMVIMMFIYIFVQADVGESFERFIGRLGGTCTAEMCSNCVGVRACMECYECGYCVDDKGNGKCVAGNPSGPYNGHCNKWLHNDPFWQN